MHVKQCKTMSIPEAGRLYFGLGENASYRAAARGEIPTIKVGGKRRVPVILMDEKLKSPDKVGEKVEAA